MGRIRMHLHRGLNQLQCKHGWRGSSDAHRTPQKTRYTGVFDRYTMSPIRGSCSRFRPLLALGVSVLSPSLYPVGSAFPIHLRHLDKPRCRLFSGSHTATSAAQQPSDSPREGL